MLQPLGLDGDVERVYRAILEEPSFGVAKIAEALDISEAKVRNALDRLVDLSLLQAFEHSNGPLRLVSPDVGLTNLLNRADAEILRRRQDVDATRAAVAAITAEFESARSQEVLVRFDGVDAVRSRLEELANSAVRECMSFNPGRGRGPDAMSASKPLDQLALERGVAIRCIYQESFRNDGETLAHARWLTALGGQVRVTPTMPMQVVIVDRKVALLPLIPERPREGAIEVQAPGLVSAVCALFEQIWSSSTPLGGNTPRDDHGLDAQELTVIKLLSDGYTDEAVGRKLGLSVRTVRRLVAELTERLGAESRFQAGAYAVRRGWL